MYLGEKCSYMGTIDSEFKIHIFRSYWALYFLTGCFSIAFSGIYISIVPLSSLFWPGESYHALEMVDGKAQVMREELCDGAGFCIGVCPTGALSIEVREALAFDEHAAEEKMAQRLGIYIEQSCHVCGASEASHVLLPCRKAGESLWVCTRCLPQLIHG